MKKNRQNAVIQDKMVCISCGAQHPISAVPSTCIKCEGILDLVRGSTGPQAQGTNAQGIWRWARQLQNVNRKIASVWARGNPLLAAKIGCALA